MLERNLAVQGKKTSFNFTGEAQGFMGEQID